MGFESADAIESIKLLSFDCARQSMFIHLFRNERRCKFECIASAEAANDGVSAESPLSC